MPSQELFFEIGMEELPASFVMPALQQLAEGIRAHLDDALIDRGTVHTFATPRRLGVVIDDVALQGKDRHREEFGPPVKIAFEEDGTPRMPALKFAEKLGQSIETIGRKEKDGKGEYLCAQVVDSGVQTSAFLQETIPSILQALHFPKTMRWGSEPTAFARPVHWLCARLGSDVLSLSFAGIQSGTTSRGHRFLAPDTFEVENYAQFKEECAQRYIVLDPQERMDIILKGARELAESVDGALWEDQGLLELNAQLSEYPIPILASYEADYLALPDEVLRTSMRNHLKCFAVVDAQGELLPYFIPVAGLPSTNFEKVREGFQRVLRARLADAQFFYDEDRKASIDALVPQLDKVVYQADLGSYGDKVRRVAAQAKDVAAELGYAEHAEHSHRAAQLYKADLNSAMVYEFPELQGIMGREYALHSNEPKEVALAIVEHYLPAGAEDEPPQTPAGQVLAVAERLDTLVGGFGVGLRPSGSADPYGLRRQAITLLRILKEHKLPGRLAPLLSLAAGPLAQHVQDQDATCKEVLGYLRDRLPQIFTQDGWSRDLIDAVCVEALIGRYPIYQLDQLFEALQKALQSGLLAGLAYSFKRVSNILRQGVKKIESNDPLLADLAETERTHIASYRGLGTLTFTESAPNIDVEQLKEEQERALYACVEQVESVVDQALQEARFGDAFEALLQLREPIDAMFDNVMVMANDAALLINRLALLRKIARLAFLDFGKIDTSEIEKAK